MEPNEEQSHRSGSLAVTLMAIVIAVVGAGIIFANEFGMIPHRSLFTALGGGLFGLGVMLPWINSRS